MRSDLFFFIGLTVLCILATGQDNTTSYWNDKGMDFAKSGQYEESMKCLNMAIEIDPQDAETWYNKGRILSLYGKRSEAIKALEKAIELNSSNPDFDFWRVKGDANFWLGEDQRKLYGYYGSPFDSESSQNFNFASTRYYVTATNYYERALDCYENATKINPQYADAWFSKGLCYIRLAESLKRQSELCGIDLRILCRQTIGCYEDAYEKAITCFEKATEINPQYVEAWSNKVAALKTLGRETEAEAAFAKANEVGRSTAEASEDTTTDISDISSIFPIKAHI